MWECFNNNEEKIVQRAFLIKRLPIEEIKQKTFICPNCLEQLSFVKEYPKQNVQRNDGFVRSHFSHKSDSKCQYNAPPGESEEHYNTKMELLDELTNGDLKVQIGNLFFFINENSFEIEWKKDETKAIPTGRADVLLKLKEPNAVLGNGIVFEIMVSEKEDSIEQKMNDYAFFGWSVCPIKRKQDISLLKIEKTFPQVLSEIMGGFEKEILSWENRIKYLKKDFHLRAADNGWYCTTCNRAGLSRKPGAIVCFKDYHYETKTGPIHEKYDFTACEFYTPRYKELIVGEAPKFSCIRTRQMVE